MDAAPEIVRLAASLVQEVATQLEAEHLVAAGSWNGPLGGGGGGGRSPDALTKLAGDIVQSAGARLAEHRADPESKRVTTTGRRASTAKRSLRSQKQCWVATAGALEARSRALRSALEEECAQGVGRTSSGSQAAAAAHDDAVAADVAWVSGESAARAEQTQRRAVVLSLAADVVIRTAELEHTRPQRSQWLWKMSLTLQLSPVSLQRTATKKPVSTKTAPKPEPEPEPEPKPEPEPEPKPTAPTAPLVAPACPPRRPCSLTRRPLAEPRPAQLSARTRASAWRRRWSLYRMHGESFLAVRAVAPKAVHQRPVGTLGRRVAEMRAIGLDRSVKMACKEARQFSELGALVVVDKGRERDDKRAKQFTARRDTATRNDATKATVGSPPPLPQRSSSWPSRRRPLPRPSWTRPASPLRQRSRQRDQEGGRPAGEARARTLPVDARRHVVYGSSGGEVVRARLVDVRVAHDVPVLPRCELWRQTRYDQRHRQTARHGTAWHTAFHCMLRVAIGGHTSLHYTRAEHCGSRRRGATHRMACEGQPSPSKK